MEYVFSTTDIADVLRLLNELLKHVSLVTLSRTEVEIADPKKRFIGTHCNRYCDIVKVINRWGIKEQDRNYNELLNGVIARISCRYRMLLIYEPVELLLFNKLLQCWNTQQAKFTKEEIEIFFLQPDNMIAISYIPESGVYLFNLIKQTRKLSAMLISKDSKEFLDQGVTRRLFMLKATVDSICSIYSDRRVKCLDDTENAVLSQNTNFFYANIYAILDCLAFVLAFEYPDYEIKRHNKKKFKNIRLFNKEFYTRITGLSGKLNLIKLKPWYDEIVNLRHPIAHRIPLYFPEVYNDEDACKIQEADDKYFKNFNAILQNTTVSTQDTVQLDKLYEDWQKERANINVFSACFSYSDAENDRLYHLSRLTLDLGILYYLLNKSFEYLSALCGSQ